MRVAVASDHAGLPIKESVLETLAALGCEYEYLGTESTTSVDFPDFAERVGRKLQSGEADRGIVLCGSGVGVCIAANKMQGVRASTCHDTYSAAQGVEHDGMNVLCLGGRIIGTAVVAGLVTAFVQAEFQPEERFKRRLRKVETLESERNS
jgi:ribose 5-phosphate isomerase B